MVRFCVCGEGVGWTNADGGGRDGVWFGMSRPKWGGASTKCLYFEHFGQCILTKSTVYTDKLPFGLYFKQNGQCTLTKSSVYTDKLPFGLYFKQNGQCTLTKSGVYTDTSPMCQ